MNMQQYISSYITFFLLFGAVNLSAIRGEGGSRKNLRDVSFKNETDIDLAVKKDPNTGGSLLRKRGDVKFAVQPGQNVDIEDIQHNIAPTSVVASGSYKYKVRIEGNRQNKRLVAVQY